MFFILFKNLHFCWNFPIKIYIFLEFLWVFNLLTYLSSLIELLFLQLLHYSWDYIAIFFYLHIKSLIAINTQLIRINNHDFCNTTDLIAFLKTVLLQQCYDIKRNAKHQIMQLDSWVSMQIKQYYSYVKTDKSWA